MENHIRAMLAGCLREDANNSYVIENIMSEFPTVQSLMSADEDELRRVKGLGLVKSKQLSCILQFVKAVNAPVVDKRTIIRSPKDVFELCRNELEFLEVEKFVVIGLNTKNHVLFKETVSSGS